ncbi:MAG TPA: polysaccharide biosynthesis C-terminal domain-containing protein [Thermoanaerobaculia bacterium]|nr:polysaccharide biosynthesis C-terminal domain-containing protein [Thermoanaerobaculia bacterium]HUM30060.1 polysaccharide biosynthesis C-terminal domain-containing protein [Thermoanaerobaculia bacterium]HXK69444.1 polysaccharide biosynthesis C-terminal domain-containing protein [Thermoanaerobaculia bacterium]
MQILALCGLLRSISATTGPLFNGLGRPHIATKLQAVRLLLIIVLIYPMTHRYGLAGTSLTILISALLIDPFAMRLAIHLAGIRIRDFSHTLLLPMMASLVALIVPLSIQPMLGEMKPAVTFSMNLFLFLVLYPVSIFIHDRITGVRTLS